MELRRRPIKRYNEAIAAIILASLLALTIISEVQGSWRDQVVITGEAKMACWKANIKIRKTLDGAYTDPITGATLEETTNLMAIAAAFPTTFKLTICVKNDGSTTLTNVIVVDTIKNTVAPFDIEVDKGVVTWNNYSNGKNPWDGIHFGFNELTWDIGTLEPGEMVCLILWIQTLQNSAQQDKYEPTSGDEGDWQDIEINEGATVRATSPFDGLTATTGDITLIIADNGIEGDGIGVIDSPELSYSTPWAEDGYV